MQKNNKILSEAFTFDDVLLKPAYSDVLPGQVDVSTYLTRNIKLNIPLISSPMDTVTESSLAIAIALKGGMGIIHKNMKINDQTEEVKKVKRSQSTIIKDPITLNKNSTVKDALQIMKRNKIFVACDSTNISKIREIINKTQNLKIKIGYKFGLEFLNSKNGRKFSRKIISRRNYQKSARGIGKKIVF